MLRDLLIRHPLLALLDTPQLDDWVAAGQAVAFETGETIFEQGSVGLWAYLVLKGRVRILCRAESGHEVPLGVASPGEFLGDYALLPPHQNTATCRASVPVRLLRLPLAPLRQAFANIPAVHTNLKDWLRLHAIKKYLRGQPFLGFQSAPSALKFLDHLRPATCREGRAVQATGLADDRWFVIESGQVLVTPSDADAGQAVHQLGPGDSFGERALLDGSNLPLAFALTEVRCLELSRAVFDPPSQTLHGGSLQSYNQGFHPATYPWVGQQGEADCGLAALAMVVRYHGGDTPVEELRRHARIGPEGTSLLELQRLAGLVGLAARAVRSDPSRLADVTVPVIAHLTGGHYAVVYEHGPSVVVGDPATSVLRLSEAAFRRTWSGHLLLLSVAGQGHT